MDSPSISKFLPNDIYTTRSDAWRGILRLVEAVKGRGEAARVTQIGRYPNGWTPEDVSGSIWDPDIFEAQLPYKPLAWGYIRVRHVVLPAFFEPIGDLLGLTPEQVRLIAWWRGTVVNGRYQPLAFPTDDRSGPRFIRDLLERLGTHELPLSLPCHPADLVLDCLPVPPLALRPGIPLAQGRSMAPPEDSLFNALLFQSKILDFFWEEVEGEPESLRMLFEQQNYLPVQRMAEQLAYLYDSGERITRWEFEAIWASSLPAGVEDSGFSDGEETEMPDLIDPDVYTEDWGDVDMKRWVQIRQVPLGIVFTPDGSTALQFKDRIEFQSTPPWGGDKSLGTAGQLIAADEGHNHLYYSYLSGISILDLSTGKWLKTFPDKGFRYLDTSLFDEPCLIDLEHKRAIRLLEVREAPKIAVPCRDGQYLWVQDGEANGGIYQLETGWLVVDFGFLDLEEDPPFLTREGDLLRLSVAAMEIMEEELEKSALEYLRMDVGEEAQPFALALEVGSWWIFAFNTLWIDFKAVWRTDMPVTAAGFAPGSRTLVLGNRDEIRTFDLDAKGVPLAGRSKQLLPI